MIEQASLVIGECNWAVKEGSLLGYKLIDGKYYPREMDVVRATTGTRVNSAGLVELVPYNLVQYSEQLDNSSAWAAFSGTTLTANAATAPDGTMTADRIQGASGGFRGVRQSIALDTTTCTLSVYLKSATGANQNARIWIDATSQVVALTTEWQRFTLTALPTTSTFDVTISTSIGASIDVYAWGAQLVEGSVAKDYQKTETRLNIPRLDYSNGTCPSILVEPQRTNLVTWSSSFDNAAWIKLNGSVTANNAISPSGIQDADSFIPNTTSGIHALRSNNFNQSSTASHSWFLKANGYSKIAVRESDLVGNYASFDLSNGTLISTNQTGSIESVGNGWYRCTLVDTTTGAGAQTSIVVLPDSYTTGDPLIAWSGDGIKGVFAYGAQVEVGSYPTSYIPTTSASVTRNADVISKTGISSLIGQTEGTIFCEINFDINVNTTGSSRIQLSDGTTTNWIFIGIPDGLSGNLIRMFCNSPSGTMSEFTSSPIANGVNKIAFAYKSGSFVLYVNGTQAAASSSSITIPTCSRIDLQGQTPNQSAFERINYNSAALWTTRLTNDQLATLTTI